jgi:hypothetical protein
VYLIENNPSSHGLNPWIGDLTSRSIKEVLITFLNIP